MRRVFTAFVTALALAACGEIESPDLETGTLTGRLVNATSAAYVYPLGRPDLVVRPGLDGRYAIEKVPSETEALVVVDGPAGSWRAAVVPVDVEGGEEESAPDVDAAAMALAGRVAAVARLGGGCASLARFTVVGTDQVDVTPPQAGAAAVLEALPAGAFQLAARSGGFTDGSAAITVVSGATVSYEVALEVENGDAAPGCRAQGASCRPGLVCSPDDGICYECLEDSHCAAAGSEPACRDRACKDPLAKAEICGPCAQSADCQSGVCAAGAFCTRSCTLDAECPAGFACDVEASACRPPAGCGALKEGLGAECFTGAGCQDHLAGGVCFGADTGAEPPKPGYCTGACSGPEDCAIVPGYACGAVSGVCERTTP